jgi:ABC-type amino acid transport substrate-binding protein
VLRALLAACLVAVALLLAGPQPARAQASPPQASPAPAPEMVVGVFEEPPFAMKSPSGEWQGVAVALWREIARRENYRFRLVEYELGPLLDALANGQVDIAVGPLLITAERERRFDMTSSFMHVSLAIGTLPPTWRNVLRDLPQAFTGRFLRWALGLFAAMVVMGFIVWLLERRRNPAHFGGGAVKGFGDAMWWSASTMSTVGYGDRTPITLWGRMVGVVWMFVSIVLVSTFTAAVTSVLTVSQLQSQIRSFHDLTGMRVGVVGGSTTSEYLAGLGIATKPYGDVEAGMADVVAGKIPAFVGEWPVLRYLETGDLAGKVSVIAQPFSQGFVGFAVQRDSGLRRPVDVALLEVLADPAWQEIVRQFLGQ